MKRFAIKRGLQGAGKLTPEELQAISQTLCEVADQLGKPYQWVHLNYQQKATRNVNSRVD